MMRRVKILEVYAEQQNEEDKPVFNWDFFGNFNAYSLIGLLDIIKDDLIRMIDEESIKNKEREE